MLSDKDRREKFAFTFALYQNSWFMYLKITNSSWKLNPHVNTALSWEFTRFISVRDVEQLTGEFDQFEINENLEPCLGKRRTIHHGWWVRELPGVHVPGDVKSISSKLMKILNHA